MNGMGPGKQPITNSTVIKKLVFYGGGGPRTTIHSIHSFNQKEINFLFSFSNSFREWIDGIKKYYNSTVIRAVKQGRAPKLKNFSFLMSGGLLGELRK